MSVGMPNIFVSFNLIAVCGVNFLVAPLCLEIRLRFTLVYRTVFQGFPHPSHISPFIVMWLISSTSGHARQGLDPEVFQRTNTWTRWATRSSARGDYDVIVDDAIK